MGSNDCGFLAVMETRRRNPLILAWTTFFGGHLDDLLRDKARHCQLKCEITANRSSVGGAERNLRLFSSADAVVFHAFNTNPRDLPKPKARRPEQIFALIDSESPRKNMGGLLKASPFVSYTLQLPRFFFNATIGYRPESDYFSPYEQFNVASDASQRWSDQEVSALHKELPGGRRVFEEVGARVCPRLELPRSVRQERIHSKTCSVSQSSAYSFSDTST